MLAQCAIIQATARGGGDCDESDDTSSSSSLMVFELVQLKLDMATEKAELDALRLISDQLEASIKKLRWSSRLVRLETAKYHRQMMGITQECMLEIEDYHNLTEIFACEIDLMQDEIERLEHEVQARKEENWNNRKYQRVGDETQSSYGSLPTGILEASFSSLATSSFSTGLLESLKAEHQGGKGNIPRRSAASSRHSTIW